MFQISEHNKARTALNKAKVRYTLYGNLNCILRTRVFSMNVSSGEVFTVVLDWLLKCKHITSSQ